MIALRLVGECLSLQPPLAAAWKWNCRPTAALIVIHHCAHTHTHTQHTPIP